ncbi:MAG: NAAT family transporter [Candidatus Scalindua sp. AMX11]|nr:MAG: hypothetical protein DWQ00_18475 [Candidatus Scalindua sp.]NOG86145.1 NAAT family transporter [Planctomycetota bacterium]RZV99001.1 MAG: NAAT family transporter [Candidatus Scalindua sp. SCAELEC01]TDE66904.1 MAG: NAAT family transporter [Candidatus Scalindua sp. AMX11]
MVSTAVTLFLVMDPIGNIPVFNGVLSRIDESQRSRVIWRELLIALSILLIFLYTGNVMMAVCGLSQSSLNISGGVLLFIIALKMIFPHNIETRRDSGSDAPFIVPLAIPLVAGPSTVAYILLLSANQEHFYIEWTLSLLTAWGLSTTILLLSSRILTIIGKRGAKALERLMGMILVIMATQMFLDGIAQFILSLQLGG